MKYYKLSLDMDRQNDIVCFCDNDFGIKQNELIIGQEFENWNYKFCFIFDIDEGNIITDCLRNNKGWLLFSEKLKLLINKNMNTEIQFLPVEIIEKHNRINIGNYYIANILTKVDALCLDKSEYFETEIEEIGVIYTIKKFAVYDDKVQNKDIFKLSNNQEIPVFASENFKNEVTNNNIIGINLREIRVC